MEHRGYIERARRVFFETGALEDDPEFKATLAGLACTGLQWGGLTGIVGLLIHVPVNVLLLGRPIAWWYPAATAPEVFVLWDEAVVALLCGGAVWIGRAECRLSGARAAGFVITGTIVAVSLLADAYRGVLSIEYVILSYLLVVAVIPYRLWQALLLGGVLSAVSYGIGHYGLPGTAAARPDLVGPGHLVRMGFVTVVLTGVSALLYAVRYRQHRARQKAEDLHEQVVRLERARSRFFANLSHEFRTPLTLILGPLQEVLDEHLGPASSVLRERLEIVEGQARRLKQLADQLFELAELDEGGMTLSMRKHDLVAFMRRIVPPFRQWADERGLTVQVVIECDRLDAWVDADRFEHVLATLLSNAITYTPEGGTVRIRVDRTDDHGEIAIRDTGPGLPRTLRERVFGHAESSIPVSAEVPGDSSASLEAEQWIGMGIGLAHANALVRRHGGRIEVESEPGFGTELTLHLPLGREHVAAEDVADSAADERASEDRTVDVGRWKERGTSLPTEEASAEEATEAPEDRPEVLVVDDEAEMRRYLQDLLGADYRVATAADGEDALERLHDRASDLVLSDVAMPGMGGVALCRAIREDEQLRHLPVVLLTARPDGGAPRPELEAGADACVSKPFDPTELKARVETLIEIRRIVQNRVRLPDWMAPEEATVSSEEAEFLEALNEAVDDHIDNSNFGVDWLADEMDLSTRHLRRRIKEATGLSAAGFIRTRRLQHAAALLRQGADTISDVASAVGYRDPSYFSRLFREAFGCSPTEYAEQEHESPDEPDVGP